MNNVTETPPACAVDAVVVRNTAICREHASVEIALPQFPPSQPGQFLQVRCGDACADHNDAAHRPTDGFPPLMRDTRAPQAAFLRRPFSIADRWDERGQTHLSIISHTVGRGTSWLEQLHAGEKLNITGPLGHGFDIPEYDSPIVLIGGGVGIPPLLYLARRLHELGRRDVTAVFGSTTRDLLPARVHAEPASDGTPSRCVELPGDAQYEAIVTTDDGSLGLRGVVTQGFEAWRKQRAENTANTVVFACGPQRMLQAVALLTRQLGLRCQLCIERTMGCGLGTCLSCVVRVRDAARPNGWRWALACSEGPVFECDLLLDEAPDSGT